MKTADGLTLLERRAYDSEVLFQAVLAQFPEVLAASTTTGDAEPRLLLVSREIGVASPGNVPGPFGADNLFLDGDGVPVLVEYKRSSNSEIRRRVVESNLHSGRIRMVFVAGALPESFVRIIEFLNEQMSLVEILGVVP